MKATEAKLLAFLQKSSQLIIPIYQRTYSWTEKQCLQLWEDINRCGSSSDVPVHFIGSIVYIEQGLSQVTHQAPLLVIDGQQRLTTVTLLIEALARRLGDSEPIEGFSAAKLRAYYLTNPLESGDRFHKLLLSQTDSSTLKSLIRNSDPPAAASLRVSENFALFTDLLSDPRTDLQAVCRGLAKLVVVDIALSREHDNPQLIFESMNSTGKELSQADLIRNYILMGLEPSLQTMLYERYWRPMEIDFGQVAYGTQFDSFMRHYLTVRSGEIPRESEVYEAFKAYSRRPDVHHAGVEALVKEIRECAKHYCAISLAKESDPILASAFQDLRELKVDVAFPFLLRVYRDYEAQTVSRDEFAKIVRLVESYVFRRSVCLIPTNSMNKTFANFARSIRPDRYLESIEACFQLLPSYRRFPKDDEFQRELLARDLYNFRNRSYWLRRLENHDRKERVAVDEYTIEHILPQNPDLSPSWQQALGPDWSKVQERWLHTIGNLTLTGYNPEYGDRPFNEKRDMKGGFAESPLRLNAGLGQLATWDEAAIKSRGARLAKTALAVWRAPRLDDLVLGTYQQPTRDSTIATYSIEDHPHLVSSPASALFNRLREEILRLDACVTEEFLKFYVAYKAETNIVDVYPQKQKLRLILNMQFQEIRDDRGICKDMSGNKLNGEVEVHLKSIDDLPYIMGLIRQSFASQMPEGPQG
jgi:uncharacterized protein with ParB-like and HNH nuclease domain/predicted transport protein